MVEPSFIVDKTPFIKVWWQSGQVSKHCLLQGAIGFGKSHLIGLLEDSFDQSKPITGPLKSIHIATDLALASAHYRKHVVIKVDFGDFVGQTFEQAEESFGISYGTSGKEYFSKLVGKANRPVILLLDNIDTPILQAYLNDYEEEAIEFMCSFLEAMGSSSKVERTLMTSTFCLFLRSLSKSLPASTLIVDLYEQYFGQFLAFSFPALNSVKELLQCQMDYDMSCQNILRKFGGYRASSSTGIPEYIHPVGIIAMCKAASQTTDLRIIAKTNAFEQCLPLLQSLFRKMDMCYLDLLELIHSDNNLEVRRNSFSAASESSSSQSSAYSFIDFVMILHDIGMLTRRGPEGALTIANADAVMALMRLSDVFIAERMLTADASRGLGAVAEEDEEKEAEGYGEALYFLN